MSEYQIGALQSVANSLLDALKAHTSRVVAILEQLRELPELVRSLGKLINDGFNRQIQSSGEFIILGRLANVTAKSSLVDAETQAIDEFKRQLLDDQQEIKDRYGKIQEELNQDAQSRVRQLDDHVLDLYPHHYVVPPLGVFRQNIEPILELLKGDSVRHYDRRTSHMGKKVGELQAVVRDFLDSRDLFFKTSSEYTCQVAGTPNGSHVIPLWLLELTTDGLSGRLQTSLPQTEDASGGDPLRELHEALDGPNGQEFLRRIPWRESGEFRGEFLRHMEQYCRQRGVTPRATEEILRVLGDSPLATVEEDGQ